MLSFLNAKLVHQKAKGRSIAKYFATKRKQSKVNAKEFNNN